MKIFYMQTLFWNCIEAYVSSTDTDIICVDVREHYDYDDYKKHTKVARAFIYTL